MVVRTVDLGGVTIGDSHPTAFVAEVGTFFNSDIDVAKQYLRRVADAGAPIFKTEILHDADVCLPNTGLQHVFNHAGGSTTEDYRALIERKIVPLKKYAELFDLCRSLGMPFIASVYDIAGIDFLVEQKAAGLKIARTSIDNVPLIRHAARTGMPVIVDTGFCTMEEIGRAAGLVKAEGAPLILNHHPGRNPCPPEHHHLRFMQTLKEAFQVPVGLACHYRGDEILYVAVGMGCNLLEKGVDLNPDRAEQDLVSAAAFSELKSIIDKVRNCSLAVGTTPIPIPEPRDLSARMCLVSARRLKKGERLDIGNVRFAWPPVGISVAHWDLVQSCALLRDVDAGTPLMWSDVDFSR